MRSRAPPRAARRARRWPPLGAAQAEQKDSFLKQLRCQRTMRKRARNAGGETSVYDDRIADMERRIEQKRLNLVGRFASLEGTIAKFPGSRQFATRNVLLHLRHRVVRQVVKVDATCSQALDGPTRHSPLQVARSTKLCLSSLIMNELQRKKSVFKMAQRKQVASCIHASQAHIHEYMPVCIHLMHPYMHQSMNTYMDACLSGSGNA